MAGVISTCRPVNSNSIYSPPRAFRFASYCSDWIAGSRVAGGCLVGGPDEGEYGFTGPRLAPSHDRTALPRAWYPHLFTIFGHGSAAQLHAISGQALSYLVIGYRPVRILSLDHLFDLEL